jgi:hypothetical protein
MRAGNKFLAKHLEKGQCPPTKNLIRGICPAQWGSEKVSGIDLSRDFFWLANNPDSAYVAALEAAGKSSRLIVVSADQRPDDLDRVRKLLAGATSNLRELVFLVSGKGRLFR